MKNAPYMYSYGLKLLKWLSDGKPVTNSDYAEVFSIKLLTAYRRLNSLVKRGYIEKKKLYFVDARECHYMITTKGTELTKDRITK